MKTIKFFNCQILVIAACLLFSVSLSLGMIVNETHIASGRIDSITNNEIRLDIGETFLPSQIIKAVSFQRGDTISLRYFINSQGRNIYIEIAAGANTLPEVVPPTPPVNRGPM